MWRLKRHLHKAIIVLSHCSDNISSKHFRQIKKVKHISSRERFYISRYRQLYCKGVTFVLVVKLTVVDPRLFYRRQHQNLCWYKTCSRSPINTKSNQRSVWVHIHPHGLHLWVGQAFPNVWRRVHPVASSTSTAGGPGFSGVCIVSPRESKPSSRKDYQ